MVVFALISRREDVRSGGVKGRRSATLSVGMAALLACAIAAPAQMAAPAELSLPEATRRAIESNLALRSVRADTGLARAQLIGSRLLPNPSVLVQYQTTGDRTAAGLESGATFSLTQDLQLWGIRSSRIRVAELEQQRIFLAVSETERLVRREVAASYRALLFQQQRIALVDSLGRLDRRIARAARAAFQQGVGSEIDVRLSEAAWAQSLLDGDRAVREYEIEQINLAQLLGDSLRASYRLTDSLPPRELRLLTPRAMAGAAERDAAGGAPDGLGATIVRYDVAVADVDSLVRIALAHRPDVRAAETEVAVQQALLSAAQAAGKPTLAVSGLVNHVRDNFSIGGQEGSNHNTFIGAGLLVGLPIGNRNQGEIARAQFGGAAASIRLASVRQLVERDVRVAAQRVALAASQVEALRAQILPSRMAALRLTESAFGRGQASIFQVLVVQRAYVESSTGLLESMRQYLVAVGDLEAAIGQPVQ